MKKSILTSLILLLSALIIGCAGAPTMQEVPGAIYANYQMGKDAEGSVGTKEGRACATSILGWVATGDASIKTAAANGGISKVTSVERESKNIIGVHATYCTVVRGE